MQSDYWDWEKLEMLLATAVYLRSVGASEEMLEVVECEMLDACTCSAAEAIPRREEAQLAGKLARYAASYWEDYWDEAVCGFILHRVDAEWFDQFASKHGLVLTELNGVKVAVKPKLLGYLGADERWTIADNAGNPRGGVSRDQRFSLPRQLWTGTDETC